MVNRWLLFTLLLSFLSACQTKDTLQVNELTAHEMHYENKELITPPRPDVDVSSFQRTPVEWGEDVTGVKQSFITSKQEMALTFDACGGPYGNQYDQSLVDFLIEEAVPATLFVNERWIHDNKELFLELSANELFQIENHGTEHKPLSVNGGEAWGIAATESAEAAFDEIMINHETVKQLTGKTMHYFRSGTAFYDEVAVELANELGYEIVNFDILGDAGATYSSTQVENALLTAKPGSIALLHMNQPRSGTAEGVKQAIPKLRKLGFSFVKLADVELK